VREVLNGEMDGQFQSPIFQTTMGLAMIYNTGDISKE